MGTKKSDFTASPTIADTSTFDFVINGENIKITKANLLAALGVTGTLSQVGAVTGTPVLDVSGGADKLIRNLEAGVGILLSLSPENGITIALSEDTFIKQNFIANGTITDNVNLATSTGTNTLVMPLTPTKGILEVKSISGTITLNPGTNTVENGNTVSTTVNRRFNLNGTVWLEL